MKIAALSLLSALVALPVVAKAEVASTFTLTSPGLEAGQTLPMKHVFDGFGCTGENRSPALSWSGAPEGTKSFAITAYDPDAPTGSGWWHWTLVNLPASTTHLAENASADTTLLPDGALQARTDYGKPGYGGACPPVGDAPHHYIFTVFALKTDKLDLTADAPGAMVGYYLHENTLAKASVTFTYGR